MAHPPRDLQSTLLNRKQDPNKRKKVAYEIHYRMPRRLGRSFQASHFTLIRRSPEDWNYDQYVSKVNVVFSRAENREFDNDVFLSERRTEVDLLSRIAESYDSILISEVALFVFGAFERVIDLVARQTIDEIGLSEATKDEIANWSNRFRHFVNHVKKFEITDFTATNGGTRELLSELGSSRRWIEREHREGGQEWPKVEGLLNDFRHMHIKKNEKIRIPDAKKILENFEYTLRWLRSPQSWNYTFIESLSVRPRGLRVI